MASINTTATISFNDYAMLDLLTTAAHSLSKLVGKKDPHPAPVVMEAPERPALFAQCHFAVVRSEALNEVAAKKLVQMINLHGGEAEIDRYNESKLALDGITHIISTTFDFPDYETACDQFIPVVKPAWIDASLARDKLVPPRQYNPDPRLFMSEVLVCCADLPDGDVDAIAAGVLAMGGQYTGKITSQVTHLVALTMESDKCALVTSKQLDIKIVLPHWFDDCLKLGRRINEQPYLLPDPDILRQPHSNAPGAAPNTHIRGATHPDPSGSALPTAEQKRRDLDVFQNKHVMLATDLGIGSHLRGILEDLIAAGKGKITSSVKKADLYICKYREGPDYRFASRAAGKEVGNLAWLYYMITNNVWTSPMRRLLHYPVARHGLPGFSEFRISLSNYSGEARTYLENLVIAAGAECTKTLKQDNTHLITAHIMSEKCKAAQDWGILLVNHLWLEESYAKWKLQSVTDAKYTHFPSRTNLGEVVGQTKIDRAALERHFFPAGDVEMQDVDDHAQPLQQQDPNVMVSAVPNHDAPQTRASATTGEMREKSPTFDHKDIRRTGEPMKNRTPAPSRLQPTGKENETPPTTGSRKSKDAAAARLHSMTPDIMAFQKEMKRVGGVVYGGRRKTDEDRVVPARKRSFDEASDSEATEENEPKKPRKLFLPPPSMHLLISGYKRWVGQGKTEDADKKKLRELGIIVTLDPARASHLAAPHILRTHKFVSAMAYAPAIISTDFIDACLEANELLDADQFLLKDKANEKKLGVSLASSRERAKENRNQLLQNRPIYCLENIHGGFDTFKSIVEANGGQCMPYRGRPGNMVPSRRTDSEFSSTDDESHHEVYLLSGPGKENSKIWTRFRQMAEGSRKVPRIVKPDWLLETAMAQKILPVSAFELHEE